MMSWLFVVIGVFDAFVWLIGGVITGCWRCLVERDTELVELGRHAEKLQKGEIGCGAVIGPDARGNK